MGFDKFLQVMKMNIIHSGQNFLQEFFLFHYGDILSLLTLRLLPDRIGFKNRSVLVVKVGNGLPTYLAFQQAGFRSSTPPTCYVLSYIINSIHSIIMEEEMVGNASLLPT
ncbi:hypothetical protein THII_1359 [Thioploca ingrica]|uniref:Uncharacterized protein n=1 Tax=Thioploca ingrica TaxID=40754 RepID=A0A090BUT3_9GAMM|nr:hypothetical protein THII_1359 [Thioploca ingrica]